MHLRNIASSARRRTEHCLSLLKWQHTHRHIIMNYYVRWKKIMDRRMDGRAETSTCNISRMEIYRHASATQQATSMSIDFRGPAQLYLWNISISCSDPLVTCYVTRHRKKWHACIHIQNSKMRQRKSPIYERFKLFEISLAIMSRRNVNQKFNRSYLRYMQIDF